MPSVFITDMIWLDSTPMTDMCVPSDMTHTAWIAGTNRIPHQPCTTPNYCGAVGFKTWFDTIKSKAKWHGHDLTIQSLLDDPLTCSSSSPSTTSSSSSSESGSVTWMQKRPLMQTQTWPSPHIMFQWMLIFMMWNKNEYSIFWQKEFWNQEMFFSFQLPKFEWPTISRLHWWKERQSNSSHKLEHTARNDSPPPMHKLTGQLNLCLCNEQLMIIKHSNHDLTWPFKTLTWHYRIEFSEDLP